MDDNHPDVFAYLPERELEIPKTPKAWIGNVITSVKGDEFNNWVKAQMNNRHQKVAVKKDIMIQMDPEIARVFQSSSAISSK